MKKFTGFEHGMGIGGWLTNYKRFNVLPQDRRLCLTIGNMEHFATYITEEDIKYIAELGMDHIRLGFDQIVFEEAPYMYREEIFEHVDRFIAWCKKYDLNIVLNMHKAVGNYCDIQEAVELLDDAELQNRFIALWLSFEKRYVNEPDIAFELLNEVRDVITVLKENAIPYCVWNYLSTPNDGNRFSLVDDDYRQILSPQLAQIIKGNV